MSRLPHLPITTIVTCAAILAITYLGFSITRDVVHNYQLNQQEAQVRSDIAQLDADHEQLAAVKDYLQSDEYIEDVARRTLGLVRPGETLVVVSSSAPAPAPTPTPAGIDRTPAAQWWKNLFEQPAAAAATPTDTPAAAPAPTPALAP